MADSKREIERKYEAAPEARLPDLTGAAGVSAVVHQGVSELDAVYYDTQDLRLAADSLTLRCRTGGDDGGWHLKFPVAPGIRDELRAPLADTLPESLAGLLRSRLRGSEPVPVVRLLSTRDVHHLVDDHGTVLAELSVDDVVAERLSGKGTGRTAAWTEIEVELADDGDIALLDAVEARLREAGIRLSASESKVSRALAETTAAKNTKNGKNTKNTRNGKKERPAGEMVPRTAGDHVLAYVRRQTEAIVGYDPGVRRDLPDSVHQMRVATRRLRSGFRTYRGILDRAVTAPLADELKWLAAELGVDRDQEVLDARLHDRMGRLPGTLVLGPVEARVRVWSVARREGTRHRVLDVLDSERYLALLDSLDALLAAPPLLPAAAHEPGKALSSAVLKDYGRLSTRIGYALALPSGQRRDVAMHEARKAAKRARYAGEAATPALGKPAKKFAHRMKAVQQVLGDHQDSVVARDAVRALAVAAHAAGESAFTWGLLYGQEEATAAECERELPGVWTKASRSDWRGALEG